MRISGLSEWLDNLADKVEKNKIRKKISDSNGESIEYLLNIPIVGGIGYVISMYFRGNRIMREIKLKQNEGNTIKKAIKDTNYIKKSLRVQLNYFVENYKVKEIEIPIENLAEFMEVLKEFPMVSATQLNNKENEFVLIVTEGVL